mmetsp:Transcript_6719/g.13860  ORF Transcript_6719/g.13860 Transcript_6719/m.13860 type:complete len:115 (-) Transcript_6719:1418-1762(-)
MHSFRLKFFRHIHLNLKLHCVGSSDVEILSLNEFKSLSHDHINCNLSGSIGTFFRSRPYFRRRSNALEGMMVASFLGISSGIYIWKPVFDEMEINRVNRERRELEQGGGGDKNA